MEEKKKTAREIIEGYDGPPVRIMEVCGTHTHEIFRLGIQETFARTGGTDFGTGVSGLCNTGQDSLTNNYLALERQVTICTFGDLVRVPGTNMSLAGARRKGCENPYCLFSSRCEGVCQRTSKGAGYIPFSRI